MLFKTLGNISSKNVIEVKTEMYKLVYPVKTNKWRARVVTYLHMTDLTDVYYRVYLLRGCCLINSEIIYILTIQNISLIHSLTFSLNYGVCKKFTYIIIINRS